MKKFIIFAITLFLFIFINIIPSNAITASAATAATNQELIDQKAAVIVKTGIDLIGKATYNSGVYKPTYPYQFGCAGYVYFVFLQNGIDLGTRSTQLQSQLGEYVPKDQLIPGDLVFFDSNPNDSYPVSHVGIYIGDNKIVHMADTKNNVIISDLNGKAYYRDYYKTARRVIPSYMPPAQLTKADEVVSLAASLIGKAKFGSPYNESTLTFTNPGFTYYVYKMKGIDLKSKLASEQVKLGVFVPKDQLQKGDLVFFSSSSSGSKVALVAIYAGNNQIIINASSSLDVVQRLLGNDFYQQHYVTARRIL